MMDKYTFRNFVSDSNSRFLDFGSELFFFRSMSLPTLYPGQDRLHTFLGHTTVRSDATQA